MVAAAVVPLGWPPLRSTVLSIITGRGCFRSLILAYTWCHVIHGYTSCAVSTMPLAEPYSSFWPSAVSIMTYCVTWSITLLRAVLLAWILKKRKFLLTTRAAHFSNNMIGSGGVASGFVIIFGSHRMGRRIDQLIGRLAITPPQKRVLWQCRSVNFIWCQLLTSCMGGYVISTWFSIVWEPKTQSCGYAECARANRTMVIDSILQTRVPLESWKNKESFLYGRIWKKF